MASQEDECFILVKAQPHRSSKYFETVCCAGIGRDGKWRRQYPVPFRILNDGQKFRRWEWIQYEYTTSPSDRRRESQKVVPESIVVAGSVKKSERSRFLNPLVRESFEDAENRGESLVLLRPEIIQLMHEQKSIEELENERARHAELARQASFFDKTAKPLALCPVQFSVKWRDPYGKTRKHECDDWETSRAYIKFQNEYGEQKAVEILKDKYENQYFKSGLALAFSTHSRRNVTYGTKNQWLLVGLIRLDENPQGDLLLGAS